MEPSLNADANRNQNPPTSDGSDSSEVTTDHPPIIIKPAAKKHGLETYAKDSVSENEATYLVDPEIQQSFEHERSEPVALALTAEGSNADQSNGEASRNKKLVYKSLTGINLPTPIRLQMWLNIEPERFNTRMNPQCVHWSTVRG